MQVKARAKLNWTLDIIGKRADGYHLLDMLVQSLELCDELTIVESSELTLSVENFDGLAADDSNLVLKAAKALLDCRNAKKGARITLKKNIPIGAGLGGGSSDAAAALRALNSLWALGLTRAQLNDLAIRLGADVPYCLAGGAKRVRGIGERLSPLAVDRVYSLILLKPCEGLATRDVFEKADALVPTHPKTEAAIDALALGNLKALSVAAGNSLLSAAMSLRPQIGEALTALQESGAAYSAMTGSGCVVYGVYARRTEAEIALQKIKPVYADAILTETFLGSDEIPD